jgi:seryl-tRNA synthetase
MSEQSELQEFYAELVRHGLIVPAGVDGIFGRGHEFESVLEGVNALILRASSGDGETISYTFPPVIDRRIVERVDYMDSFPDLCGVVYSFLGKEREARKLSERIHAGEDWTDTLGMTQVALNPAACYPLYPTMSGTLPRGGKLVTMLNWVFRHEPSPEPTRMQSFRVREFVRLGSFDEVLGWRDQWLERGVKLLRTLGLDASPEVASDPFFGRGGKILAVNQKDQKLKYEVVVPVASPSKPTAVCSFNFHQQHFGSTFSIRTAEDEPAFTACLGFGLERVVMALLRKHGFEPKKWPPDLQRQLWP